MSPNKNSVRCPCVDFDRICIFPYKTKCFDFSQPIIIEVRTNLTPQITVVLNQMGRGRELKLKGG